MTDPTPEALASVDPWYWAFINKMQFQAGAYELAGHEYQVEPLQCEAQVTVDMKGSQLGFTQIEIVKDLHGLRYHRYPQGVLYLFPTDRDVSEFSKARFAPLIERNRASIGRFIQNTDSTNLKQIGDAFLFFRGARVTQKVEGMVKESSKLRSIPVDRVVYDEEDLMDPEMVEEAKDRYQHSKLKEESHISTPSIPDFGIDRRYQESDQRVWTI
jgi:phage terminase large subunit GpA-like protein